MTDLPICPAPLATAFVRRAMLALGAAWAVRPGPASAAWPGQPAAIPPKPTFPTETPDSLARRQRSNAALRAAGVPVLESLPVLPSLADVTERTRDEVAHRIKCLAVVGVVSEEASAGPKAMARLKLAPADFTPREQLFLQTNDPVPAQRAYFNWHYECLPVLMWSQGTWTMAPPADLVDVRPLTRTVLDVYGAGKPLAVQPRPLAEVLDMADLVYRQHWAATNARINGKPPVPGLNEEVLVERHRALGWLTGGAAWDDVDLST